MAFKNKIFGLFGSYEKIIDSNKDVTGKGSFERYMEAYGDDIDTNIIALIENLTQNLIDPELSFARFLDYHEAVRGVLPLDFTRGEAVSQAENEWMRRRVLRHIEKLVQIKGTRKVYDVLFRLIAPTITVITIQEYFFEYRFDLHSFDNNSFFDSSICSECPEYSVDIITSPVSAPSTDVVKSIQSIVKFNHPIDSKIKYIKFNTTNIAI